MPLPPSSDITAPISLPALITKSAPVQNASLPTHTEPCSYPTRLPAMSVNTFMANLSAVYEPGAEGAAGTAVCAAMGAGGCATAPATMVRTNA